MLIHIHRLCQDPHLTYYYCPIEGPWTTKRVRSENCYQDAIKRNIKPKFSLQTAFRTLFIATAKTPRSGNENCQNVYSETCVNFGRCYGNQGAEAVENKKIVLKMSSFKLSECLKSVAEGVLEIFQEVYLGGGGGGTMCPLPWLGQG